MKKIFFTLILIFPFLIVYPQDTINVPGDYTSIQAGINAASNGDLVLVEDGTYLENINYKGKAITVTSRFLVDSLESHIENTIIDGSQPNNPDSGSVVYYVSGEDTNSVLCGFTITGGTGTFIPAGSPPSPPFNLRIGGGIYISYNMGARITHNIIEQNVISTTDYASGGGIYSEDPGGNGYSIIEENIIRNNTASGEITFTTGGGICMGGNGRIVRNTITGNLCHSINTDVIGGGIEIWLLDGSQDTAYCLVEDNIISDNKSVSVNGSAHAAGLNSSNTVIDLKNNEITNNIVETNVESWGVAMHLGGLRSAESRIENNHFIGNHYIGSGTFYGGAMYISNSHPMVVNNIINNNEANLGGGIYLVNNSQPEFINNTIFSNTANNAGGGFYSNQTTLTILNSILWENLAPSGSQICNNGGFVNVNYSDVEGGWSGMGNIDLDPELMDTVLTSGDTLFACLQYSSQCIDAGDPDSIYNDPEDPNNLGYALWPSWGMVRNDMGAYGGPGAIEWRIITDVNEILQFTNKIPTAFKLLQNYPNPFNPSTKIKYLVNSLQKVILKVYDLLGREIATLVDEEKPAGTYVLTWNAANLPSGVYFYQLKAGNYIETKKMVLLK